MKTTRLAPLAAALLLAAGCGGSSAPEPGPTHAVGVTVAGLAGAGMTLHLGPATPGQDLAVAADGLVQFPGKLAEGAAYAVSVKKQPTSPWQVCTPEGGSSGGGAGTMGTSDAVVSVTCATEQFSVGGTVTGLAGAGLSLRLNGGAALEVPVDGAFSFPPVPSGTTFVVTVATHPQSPRQACQVVGITGEGVVQDQPVQSVLVTCRSDVHAVGGSVDGRTGSGLTLRLQVGGVTWSDDLPVSSSTFAFPAPVPEGDDWVVTVSRQPTSPWQACEVAGGAGVMGTADVSSVAVTCTNRTFAIGGHVDGLLQAGLSLRLTVDGIPGQPVPVAADGSFTLQAGVESGKPFLVAVESLPDTQACQVTAPADVVAGTAVVAGEAVDVTVACGCAPGRVSCSQLGQDGCETNVLADRFNCGTCGNACPSAHGTADCADGQCTMSSCDLGYGDCAGAAIPDCETNLNTNPAHCSACNAACGLRNVAVQACSGGGCAVGTCDTDFADCDLLAPNGCEVNLQTSAAHCGGCGNACGLANVDVQACAAGQCAVGTCTAPYENCDGQATNGCEASLASDPLHCGACNTSCPSYPNAASVCNGGLSCSRGDCDVGFYDCNGLPGDGCESRRDQDPLNCGACGTVCPSDNGTAGCLNNACTMKVCDPGWDNCRGDAIPGCETFLATDPLHCGSCGRACGAGQICSASTCLARPSCLEILLAGESSGDGTYTIDPDGAGAGAPVQVFCDMTTDGGGWTFFAHVNGDYQAGRLFEVDLGTYDPGRGDGDVSYGLGAKVYQRIGATELMVSVNNSNPAITLGSSLVFYKFATTHRSFTTGPIPCDFTDSSLLYRTLLGSYLPGVFGSCDFETWYPYTGDPFGGGQPLVMLSGSGPPGVGTIWGTGAGAVIPPPQTGDNIQNRDSWWYAR